MEIKNFGSLYLNGQPSELNAVYGGGDISLGDTVPGKAIHFVKWKNLWVASEIVCPNASWTNLNKHNFITGWPIRIDGVPYLCRSLKVGEERYVPNEWDDILNDLGEDNSLWHWDKMYFWGQETFRKGASDRAVRGYYSARNWSHDYASSRHVYVGFRPALEPLPPAPLISDSLIGATLKLYGPSKAFSGRLEEFSDYDLVIEPSAQQLIPADCKWVSRDGSRIIIDRSAITWIQEVD